MPPSQPPPQPSVAPRPTGRRRGVWLLLIVLALHTWAATRLFPGLTAIINPATPVVLVDHAIHEYHGALGAGFLRSAGTTWGYDPFFMAGYPETPVWDSSSNPSIAAAVLGSLMGEGTPSYRPYKIGLFAASVLGVVALALGARAAGSGWTEAAVAAALAAVYFWIGYPNALWRSGLFAFLTAAIAAPLLLGLCARFDRQPTWPVWLGVAGAGAGLFFVHVTAPILVGGGLLCFYACVARQHGRRWHGAIAVAVGVTVAANLAWLVALWRFRGLRVGSGFFMTRDSAQVLLDRFRAQGYGPPAAWAMTMLDSARFLLDYYLSPSVDSRLGLILIVLGSAGLVGWWFRGKRPAAAAFGGSTLFLILLTGFGSLWEPTRVLEPLRFRVAFCYLLAVPAASCLVGGSALLARRLGGGRVGRAATVGAWVAVLATWGTLDSAFVRAAGSWLVQYRPLVVEYPREALMLTSWLRANTDLSARILFEDQLRLYEATDPESTHWTPLLPALLHPNDRLFIGGLYQTAFIQHHQYAAFGDFRLGDRPIDEWTPAQIRAYADQYNVGWVVCWSPLSRFVFDRLPGATRVATLPRFATYGRPPANNEAERTAIVRLGGGVGDLRQYIGAGESTYAVYRLDRPHSYFLRGQGRVVAVAPNRIELADVEPDSTGSAVLAMHWLDSFRADPPTPIGPEPNPPDPVPFIRIEAKGSISRLVLENGYRW